MVRLADCFYSIQGEGTHAGVPAIFLRLQGCNLHCGIDSIPEDRSQESVNDNQSPDASWVCDTMNNEEGGWISGKNCTEEEVLDIIKNKSRKDIMNDVQEGRCHIVLTGGEPLLQQEEVVNELGDLLGSAYVEVETNGTIKPDERFCRRVDQFNVSPKLSNSGMLDSDRCNELAIRCIKSHKNSWWKFVVNHLKDLKEIQKDWVSRFDLPENRVIIMPGVQRCEKLDEIRPTVVGWCKKFGYRYSDRLQVTIYDEVTSI